MPEMNIKTLENKPESTSNKWRIFSKLKDLFVGDERRQRAMRSIRAQVEYIASQLKDNGANARQAAFDASRVMGKDEVKWVVACLNDENKYVRMAALYVLDAMNETAVAPYIRKVIARVEKDKDPDVRVVALYTLDTIGGELYLDYISACQNDKEEIVREAAKGIIRQYR